MLAWRIPKRKDPAEAGSFPQDCGRSTRSLGRLNVRCGRTLRPLLHAERDSLTLGQALEARAHDGGVMHEDILGAILWGDEP